MFYSGLLMTSYPGKLQELEKELQAFPDVEIHQRDAAHNRLILVLEALSIDEEADRFNQLRKLPHAADLSLVVHRKDDKSDDGIG